MGAGIFKNAGRNRLNPGLFRSMIDTIKMMEALTEILCSTGFIRVCGRK